MPNVKMKTLTLLLLLATALALTATACGPAPSIGTEGQALPSPTAPPLDTGATPEPTGVTGDASSASGKLVLYTSRSEALIKPVIDAFAKAQPSVEVVLLTGQNGELAAKLLEEQANPQADLFVNTDSLTVANLGGEGIFEPYKGSAADRVPAEYRAADNSWVALTLRPRVIMYNTELVPEAEAPKSVFELTDAKWKGQVGSSDSTNGSMQGHIAAIRHLLGEQKAEEFVRGLVANDTKFFGGHTDVRKAVGAGELKVGLVNHYYYHLSKAEGAPVGIVYPDQAEGEMGLVVNSTNAGIVKGGPNPAAAQAFVDFLLSNEGQRIFAELNFEYPIVAEVPLKERLEPLSKFRLADVTLSTLADELGPTRELMERAGLP